MILETERLYIASLAYEDLDRIWEWKQARVARMMHNFFPLESSFEEFVGQFISGRFANALSYGVHLKESLDLIGAWWAATYNRGYREITVSAIFDAKFHRAGYDMESGRALIDLMTEQGCSRFMAYIDEKNIPVKRLAAKMGFEKEGVHRYPGKADIGAWAYLVEVNGTKRLRAAG